jgi:hypothetical protein
LLDELEESKQSRLRAWNVLQRLRLVLSQLGNMEIPPPALKTFDAEGEILEHALAKSLRIRNETIKSLCSSVRRFRDATIKPECKNDYPHALQAMLKALKLVLLLTGSSVPTADGLILCGPRTSHARTRRIMIATTSRRLNSLFRSGSSTFWHPVYSSKFTSGG